MTLRYIFHSCFVLETEHCILVFDYWMDPAKAMDEYMDTDKRVYVFSSHFHEDHFSRNIFRWKERMPNITYILSKDIFKRKRAQREEADVWMAKGAVWEDDFLQVIATGSNDSGVSWVVELKERNELYLDSGQQLDNKQEHRASLIRIFHAGDLCNWYARFLADDSCTEKIMNDGFGLINPAAEEKRFLGELKDISKIATDFDVVMFPVDGRIGNGYTLGGRQFISRFNVGLFVPMHFVASGFESAWRMEPFCKEAGINFWSIKEEGETKYITQD